MKEKDLVVGSIQFSEQWKNFLELDRKINDRVALNMYKALKKLVNSKKLASLQANDQKAFDQAYDAIVEYEVSYNLN